MGRTVCEIPRYYHLTETTTIGNLFRFTDLVLDQSLRLRNPIFFIIYDDRTYLGGKKQFAEGEVEAIVSDRWCTPSNPCFCSVCG